MDEIMRKNYISRYTVFIKKNQKKNNMLLG